MGFVMLRACWDSFKPSSACELLSEPKLENAGNNSQVKPGMVLEVVDCVGPALIELLSRQSPQLHVHLVETETLTLVVASNTNMTKTQW